MKVTKFQKPIKHGYKIKLDGDRELRYLVTVLSDASKMDGYTQDARNVFSELAGLLKAEGEHIYN